MIHDLYCGRVIEEYYINGTQHSKDSHKKAKKDGVGLPWYKSSVAKARSKHDDSYQAKQHECKRQ